jgi:hypothetical protein
MIDNYDNCYIKQNACRNIDSYSSQSTRKA